jgi:hypothetical protein
VRQGSFIGAAENPFADPFEYRPYRLANKINAGAILFRPSVYTIWIIQGVYEKGC